MRKSKLLKTLLIPSLCALTLGTIATVATSCGEQPKPSTYSVSGGSLSLSGEYGTAGSDEKTWVLKKDGEVVTDGVTWSIVEPVSGVSITDGKVSWTNRISSGTYKFRAVASYNNQTYTSENITLTITNKCEVTGGSLSLSGEYGTAGSDEKTWVLKKDGEVVTDGVTWSIVEPVSGVSITDGKVSWTNRISSGTYKFRAVASYNNQTYTSENITLTITNKCEVTGGSLSLSGEYGTAGSDEKTWVLKKDGEVVTDGVTWSIVEPVSGVSITDGKVSWTNRISSGTYKFRAVASYNNQTYTSENITLTITNKCEVTGGSLSLSGEYGTAGSDEKTWVLKKDGEVVTDGVTWSIVEPVSGVSITDGKVSWTNRISSGTYKFRAVASYNNQTYTSENITLTITNKCEVTGGSLSLSGEYGTAGSDEKTWVLKKDGEVVTDGVTWSIVEPVSGVSITDGKVSWTNTMEIGTHNFKVAAAYNEQTYLSTEITLVINAVEYKVEGGRVELFGSRGVSGFDDKTWVLKKDGQEVTEGVTWSIVEPVSGVSITDGKVSWTNTMEIGTHNFKVAAAYNEQTYLSTEITLVINAVEYKVEGGSLSLSGEYGTAGSDEKTWVLKKDGEVVTDGVTWSIVEPVSGVSINNGKVSWSNEISKGTYKFKVVATYKGLASASNTITLNINGVYQLVGESKKIEFVATNTSRDKGNEWHLMKDGEVITEGVTWKLVETEGSSVPEWIKLNENNEISWTNAIEGTYSFNIQAEYDGKTFTSSSPFVLNVAAKVFECVEVLANENSTLQIINEHNYPNLSYSFNGLGWYPYVFIPLPSIPKDQTLYLKGFNLDGWSHGAEKYSSFEITGDVSISGNVMGLLDDGTRAVRDIPSDGCFYELFKHSEGIKSVSDIFLPSTYLRYACYWGMFENCTSLTQAPALPATELIEYCYDGMFEGCTSLIDAPELPATTLDIACYSRMFQGCTSLNSIKIGYTGIPINAPEKAFDDWVKGIAKKGTFYYNGPDCPPSLFYFPDLWVIKHY